MAYVTHGDYSQVKRVWKKVIVHTTASEIPQSEYYGLGGN